MSSEFFLERNGKSQGPLSATQLKSMAAKHEVRADDIIRKGRDGQPIVALKIKGLVAQPPTAATESSNRIESPLEQGDQPTNDIDSTEMALSASPIASPSGKSQWANSRLPIAFSGVALALSATVVAWTFLRDAFGPGINSYDFTTPQKAIESALAIEDKGDVRAMIQLRRFQEGTKLAEKRRTLKVHRESEYHGQKILFTSFQQNGIVKHDIEAVEKDAESGRWIPRFVFTLHVEDLDLQKAMRDWKNNVDAKE